MTEQFYIAKERQFDKICYEGFSNKSLEFLRELVAESSVEQVIKELHEMGLDKKRLVIVMGAMNHMINNN